MKEKHAVKDLSLEVETGDIYGFIGPNGAGKSTTIKMLLGLLRKSSGDFDLIGHKNGGMKSLESIGYLPEHPYFYDYLTGRELLEFYGKLLGLNSKTLKKRIPWCLDMVHANNDWIDSKLRSYSKGMMQRVGLAQAILNQPQLLILDEPMSGLDPIGRRDVRNTIIELNHQGTTVFYSSHVLSDVEAISTKVGIIIDGQMRREGIVDDILQTTHSNYQIQLKGEKLDDKVHHSDYPMLRVGTTEFFECENTQQKDQFISWAQSQDLSIEQVVHKRPNLEEILTQEIAKNV